MPELPEVETIRRQLQKSIVGKKIATVSVYLDKMVKVGPGKISSIKMGSKKESVQFAKILVGEEILDVSRRAKYLIIHLSNKKYLLIHLRMSGQMIVLSKKVVKNPLMLSMAKTAVPQTLPSKHTHVEVSFTSGDKLFYNDTRQFGHLRVVDEKEFDEVLKAQNIGPEPLTLKAKEFAEMLQKRKTKRIKDLLLDQSAIAGIGNIYADEALFAAGILPTRRAGKIKPVEQQRLLKDIQKVLRSAIQAGGSSLEYFLKINGDSGKFVSKHKVYGRAGLPCVICKRPLSTAKIGSRTAVFCRFDQR